MSAIESPLRTRNALILLTSSFPFGTEEAFLEAEVPYLAEAYDEVVVVTDADAPDEARPLPAGVRVLRRSRALSGPQKAAALAGLLAPEVRRDLADAAERLDRPPGRTALATTLVTRHRAARHAGLLRTLARERPESRVHAYAYWADDMAVAAAMARERGWVDGAWCRAHGWDVYEDRTGFLPFRGYLAEHLDHMRFVSEHGLRYFEARMGRSYPSLGVSRLGTPHLADAPLGRAEPFTVLSCSALIPLKRVEVVARALAAMAGPVRWVHLGDGPSRAEVEAACRALPERVRVELRGRVAHDEVLQTYAALRPTLLLNVSATEGLPVSMMEAMSAGVPVVATSVGGVPEIVVDGVNGILLSPSAGPEEVAAALERLRSLDPEAYGAMARGARATWDARFRADRNFPAFVEATASPGEARSWT